MPFTIRQPKTAEEFKQYYHLRWTLLRAPWSQAEGSEIDDIEDQCFHFVAIDDKNAIIAVARLQFNANSEAQIRYMAVEPTHERLGVGRQLINVLEQHAIEKNCTLIVLDARESAIDFYKKSGYNITKKTYLLFDEIQHYRMIKNLTNV
ncbi:MAG: GNAT family N-acetyltransferase [Gammaproteobacteria bacterium]|nr:MAG: GNAT family N-acetyltransferase [Gammaproteobacteria bacterium]